MLTLTGGAWGGPSCAGYGGYDDIRQGATVVVTNSTGRTVGLGHLSRGEVGFGGGECAFSATVDGIPTGSAFYAIEVGHRGKVTFSAAEMDRTIHMTLG